MQETRKVLVVLIVRGKHAITSLSLTYKVSLVSVDSPFIKRSKATHNKFIF